MLYFRCSVDEIEYIIQGTGLYTRLIKSVEEDTQVVLKRVNELTGIKESETGLAPPALWDLAADKQALQSVFRGFLPFIHKLKTNNDILLVFKPGFYFSGEQPLQVARCTKIINADSDDPKYVINVKQFAKFVVDLSDQVAPTDIEEGMRVG